MKSFTKLTFIAGLLYLIAFNCAVYLKNLKRCSYSCEIWYLKNTYCRHSSYKYFLSTQRSENPLPGCFETLFSLSYLVCPNKTLTPVMGLPLGMGCLFRLFTRNHPIPALFATLCCFVKVLQYVPCTRLWPCVFTLMCLCVSVYIFVCLYKREKDRWVTPSKGERSQMMLWIV